MSTFNLSKITLKKAFTISETQSSERCKEFQGKNEQKQ
jgi:hypothetical protein